VSKGVYASGAVLVNEFTVQYSYDSMGRMLRRDNGTDVTTFVWDGWDLLSETTGSVTTTYLVPDGLVWSFSRGEDVFQVHTDALGSVRVVTDSDGDVVARFEYSAWGELLPGSFDSVGLALRFVGALGVRTDLETGLLWMRHRWYDASSQRFISRDPIGLRGGSNTFTYVGNNPVNFVDPEGLQPYILPKNPVYETLMGRKVQLPPFLPEESAAEEDELGHPMDYKVPPGKATLVEPWYKRRGQNCHGYVVRTKKLLRGVNDKTIAVQDSQTMSNIIDDAIKAKILQFKGKNEAYQVGDIVVYGNYKHSGVVTNVVNGVPEITSDWAEFGTYRHGLRDLQPAYKNQPIRVLGAPKKK